MASFEDLHVWRMAMNVVEGIYALKKKFPPDERFGLTSQMRRSAVSIVANIAEGFGRFTYRDKARVYTIARGECTELKALLLIALRLQLAGKEEARPLLRSTDETGKMLSGLIRVSKHNVRSPSSSPP